VSDQPFLGVASSATGRIWRARCQDDRAALAIAQAHGLPEVLARVLAARGVGLDEVGVYLAPTLKSLLPDPSRFLDMERAATRLAEAIERDEPVAVFGDYDVDGATSAALLIRFFRALGRDLRLYVPDRQAEGYGPNAPALRRLAAEGIRLVVTVDCGTLAFEALEAAAEAGLEVLIADHHQAAPDLPKALACVNPNRMDESGACRELAAVGVTFLLVVAVNRALRSRGFFGAGRPEPDLLQWLDLVALGTVADVVPLKDLNRALVAQGIKVMARGGNPGLAALGRVAAVDGPPGTYHLGFLLGPRVNAGGRVGRSDLGARLLSTDDPEEAALIAAELDALNRERQGIEAQVLAAAMADAEAQVAAEPDLPVVVAAGQGWHPGVVGIVAGRLKEQFGRPAFALARDGALATGSGRSIAGVDLGAAVAAALQAGILRKGGGHAMAAGVTLDDGRIGDFARFLGLRIGLDVAAARAGSGLEIDAALAVGGVCDALADGLAGAGPFGSGNPEPRFALTAARILRADVLKDRHVRCVVGGADGGRVDAIAFRALEGPLGPALLRAQGAPLHVAGHLRAEVWQGRRRLKFHIEDVAPVREAS
jgi:single-stranded-DNA-specific exonuclease